jgi:hypothetical protein
MSINSEADKKVCSVAVDCQHWNMLTYQKIDFNQKIKKLKTSLYKLARTEYLNNDISNNKLQQT